MKNKLAIPVAALVILMSCNSAKKSSSETMAGNNKTAAADNGWVSLFDGKTTTGWHSYGKDKAGARWTIADGAIFFDTEKKEAADGKSSGDLVTDKEYENFHLKLEWKISRNGNSGIIFYVHEDTAQYKATYHTGPEMQVLDNDGHSDGKIIKHRTGDLYDLISSSKETVKPVGEWNEAEIIAKDGKLDFVLNGTNIVSTTMWDDNWRKLVAGSKFKGMPGFSIYKKGKIALQDHGNMVWYRNIKIKEL